MLAYATVFERPGLPDDIGFIQIEGRALKSTVGPWFGTFFWIIGAFSLFAAALGIVDYTCRLVADVIKTAYARDLSESVIYFSLVWLIVLIGIVVLLVGFDQPIALIVISAVTGGLMMFIYSALLILINRKILPRPLRITGVRLAVMVWSIILFGTLSALTIEAQWEDFFG
jgi:hypothetical protein